MHRSKGNIYGRFVLSLAAVAGLSATSGEALGTTDTWKGGFVGYPSWSSAGFWSPGGVPVSGDTVVIPYLTTDYGANALIYDWTSPLSGIAIYQASGVFAIGQGNLSAGLAIGYPEGTAPEESGWVEQTGGSLSGTLDLGAYDGSSYGLYQLSGGTLAESEESVGEHGSGDFQQTGGSNIIGTAQSAASLIVGEHGPGTYTLSTGSMGFSPPVPTTGTITDYGSESIGLFASGLFNQSSGTNSTETLYLGQGAGVTGTYQLSGGILNVGTTGAIRAGGEYIGYLAGTGAFTQSGGTHEVGTSSINNDLYIGDGASTIGSYTLNNYNSSSTLIVYGNEYLGYSSQGTTNVLGTVTQYGGSFFQNGGTHAITGSLILGDTLGSTAFYNLQGGILGLRTSATGHNLVVGYSGNGVFNQTGGSTVVGFGSVSNNLYIAYYGAGGNSSYNLNGPGATLTVTGNAVVGGADTSAGGTGSLNITAGTANITGNLKIWPTGTVNFISGNLTVGSLDTSGNPLLLNWTGGNLSIQSPLLVDTSGPLGPSVSVPKLSSLTVTGAITNNGTITLASSTLTTSSLSTNNGSISGSGVISGTGGWTNNGLITQSGTLNYNQAELTNYGTINLNGGQFELTNQRLDNAGSVNLHGSTVTGSAGVENDAAGTILGYGSIASLSGQYNNGGIVAQGGTLTVTSSFTNYGVVQAELGATLAGGAIANDATISGNGTISSPITNYYIVEPTGGALNITSAFTTIQNSEITAATGNELDLTGGINANAGIIALAGGTIKVVGQLTNNTATGAQITGYGILTTTGGLVNVGTILLAAGSSTINGSVINAAYANLTVQNGSVLFTGAVTNAGNFTVLPGGSVTFAASYGGGATSDALANTGNFNDTNTFVATGNVTNSGTITFGGTQTWSAGTSFVNTAGTATLTSDLGSAAASLVSVNVSGGRVTISSTQHLAGLSISAGAIATASLPTSHTARSLLVTGALTFAGSTNAWHGELDLTGNDMIVHGGNLPTITNQIKLGFNGGNWQGTAGITSSAAAADTTHLTALGVIQNSTTGGHVLHNTFDNYNSSATDVLIKYTYYGDATLSGTVSGSDYTLIDNGCLNHLTGWYNGDFNYDGVINGSDYTLIDNAFNRLGASLAADVANPGAEIAAEIAGGSTSVPEPVVSTLMAVGIAGLLGRRTRSAAGRFKF